MICMYGRTYVIWCAILLNIAFSETSFNACNANDAIVHVESSLQTLSKTIASERVNYPPYLYTKSVPRRKLIDFALNDPITDTSNNPCNTSTWTIPSIIYDNAIILLKYSTHFATICTPQQWTLNLQTYNTNIQAVLIINTNDLNNPSHTYVLPGDKNLLDPIIPTRMISYSSYDDILNIINNTNEDIYASIGCGRVNNTSPALICIQDESSIGSHVQLYGEYHKQANTMNGHPIWFKAAIHGILEHQWLWFSNNYSSWVIGDLYSSGNDTKITAECFALAIDNVTDPTQCSDGWYDIITDKLLGDLYIHNGSCDISNNFVCVDSDNAMFNAYFGGRYRQIYDGTAAWFNDNTKLDSYLSIEYINMSFASGMSFVFMSAANRGVYAFCVINEDSVHQFNSYASGSGDLASNPWNCNKNWYIVIEDELNGGYQYFSEQLIDINKCNQQIETTIPFDDEINVYSKEDIRINEYMIAIGIGVCVCGVMVFLIIVLEADCTVCNNVYNNINNIDNDDDVVQQVAKDIIHDATTNFQFDNFETPGGIEASKPIPPPIPPLGIRLQQCKSRVSKEDKTRHKKTLSTSLSLCVLKNVFAYREKLMNNGAGIRSYRDNGTGK